MSLELLQKLYMYVNIYLLYTAPKKVPAEQHYAEPYAITTTTKGIMEGEGVGREDTHLGLSKL